MSSSVLGAKIPAITRVSAQIIRILGCNPGPMTLQGTNTYLLGSGNERILIDTGDPDIPKYIDNIRNILKEEKAGISEIILTHWHHDHVGGVKDIINIDSSKNCRVWKYPRTDAPDICEEIPNHVEIIKLENGQTFEVEGAKVKIVHTPGHTTDHVILTMDDGSLFSGDCILGEGTAVFEDLNDYMESLERILDLKPTKIYPGHGNIIENPLEKIKYYIDHRNQREKQILAVFQSNQKKSFDEMDIVNIVYTDIPENVKLAAAFNVNHHLVKLVKNGLLKQVEENGETRWIYVNKNSSL